MKTKLKKGMYITFDADSNVIYKILDVDKKYILFESEIGNCWERIEYVENVISFEKMEIKKYVDC